MRRETKEEEEMEAWRERKQRVEVKVGRGWGGVMVLADSGRAVYRGEEKQLHNSRNRPYGSPACVVPAVRVQV